MRLSRISHNDAHYSTQIFRLYFFDSVYISNNLLNISLLALLGIGKTKTYFQFRVRGFGEYFVSDLKSTGRGKASGDLEEWVLWVHHGIPS